MIRIPLTPEAFAAKSAQLAAEHDIALHGPVGELSKSGVKAAYRYADGMLEVSILEKPFFVSTQYCEEQLRKFLA